MPISNLKYRLRVKDKYKAMFPLEDPTPYWEEINTHLHTKSKQLKGIGNPQDYLELMIKALNYSISFLEEYVPHSPADRKPYFYVVLHLSELKTICSDVVYFQAEEQMLKDIWVNLNFQKKMLTRLDSILNNTYTPLSDFEKESIKRRYYEFNKRYDPTCHNFHKWFS